VPLDAHDRNRGIGKNAADRCVRREVFESHEGRSKVTPSSVTGAFASELIRDGNARHIGDSLVISATRGS
jgi:hypothetical protein